MAKIIFALLAATCAWAEVRLPRIISDRMMLQRDIPVRIWGTANPGEQVSVKFRNETASATADALGHWAAYLKPLAAGGPDTLTVAGTNSISVRDVLVGDVWIASGQSNMNWSVKQSNNAQSEIASANYPQIRLFKVAQKVSHYPLDDVEGFWSSANSDTVGDFSAVGYFFARYLHGHLRVPVGVVQTAWGGTPAESWTSLPALATDPALLPHLGEWANTLAAYPQARIRYEAALKEWEKTKQGRRPQPPQGPEHQWMPGGLYNAMIAPLTPFAIRGAIWYQGESNTGAVRAPLYGRLFQTMIQDWRARWAQGDFPFLFVQLANYGKTGANSMWPQVREAQLETLALRHTGMAVTIDIGDPGDIHPTNKQDVGKRLGLGARSAAYGEKLVYSGPVYRQMAREGNAIRLWFDHAPSLVAKNGALQGFTIAGADRKFLAAEARIEGNTVVVTSTSVPNPAAVRYAWADAPECNLYNGEGLPASPFRTDRW